MYAMSCLMKYVFNIYATIPIVFCILYYKKVLLWPKATPSPASCNASNFIKSKIKIRITVLTAIQSLQDNCKTNRYFALAQRKNDLNIFQFLKTIVGKGTFFVFWPDLHNTFFSFVFCIIQHVFVIHDTFCIIPSMDSIGHSTAAGFPRNDGVFWLAPVFFSFFQGG